jgi:LuxR family maltose regulon positive regulatory protein
LNETRKYGEMYPEKYARSIMDLTHKELEILKLIEDGLSNKEISEKLSVSLATVKTHINHIYSKLNTKNRVQTINKLKNQTKV